MAVYTDITDEELETLLADFDIGAPLSLKGVAEGIENSNFLLETETGRFILTIYEKRVRADDLPYFLDLLTWLSQHGFPVADRQGRTLKSVRGKPAAIVTFLPGLSVRRPNAAHCREAGAGLAWLHMAASGFARTRENTLGQPSWRAVFAPLEAAAEVLKPGLSLTIRADLDALDAAWPADLPTGVIHADFFPDNVFFRGEAVAGAIDFYFACNDLLAYDIAIALNAWCFEADGSFNLTSARALVAGYESRRPLHLAERAALSVLARGAAMRFFLTRLADWGSVPEGALVRPKSPLEYERKLAVHRESTDLLFFGPGA